MPALSQSPGKLSVLKQPPVRTRYFGYLGSDIRKLNMVDLILKGQREIETAVSNCFVRFFQEYLGKTPRNIYTFLLMDLLVVRVHGALNAGEEQLLRTCEKVRGRDLLKQLRKELIETARPILVAHITEITGLTVISLHHDISTVTGEEVIIFTFVEAPPLYKSRN